MGKEKSKHKSKSSKHKHRKDKKRRRDDSSSSESSSDTDSDRAERKKQKSEQLAKKVLEHVQKTAKGPDAPFVWAKKVEKEIGQGKKLKDISLFSDKNRQQDRLDELEKVRKRQAEREAEKARREEELSMVQRMRAAQEAMESEAKEEEFYLQSLLAKAERRLRESRPAPSDLIARNLHVGLRLGDPADFNLKEPWKFFEGLQLDDAQALYDDIKEYAEFDKYEPLHVEFWKALLEVAEHELQEARKRDQIDRAHLKGGPEAAAQMAAALSADEHRLHQDVEHDILVMLKGQTYGELCTLESNVHTSLEKGEGDPEYWLAVQSRLKIFKSKAHVREILSRIVSATLQRLAQEAAEAADEMGLSESPSETDFSEEETDEPGEAGREGRGAGAGAGPSGAQAAAAAGDAGGAKGFGAGSAVAKAMGWAKEKRGVVRAEGLPEGEEAAAAAAGGEAGQGDGDAAAEAGPGAAGGPAPGSQGAGAARPPAGGAAAVPVNPEEIDLDGEEAAAGAAGAAAATAGPSAAAAGLGQPAMAGPAPAQVVYPTEVPGWRRRPRRRHRGDGPDPNDEARRVGGDAELTEEVIADGTMSPVPLPPSEVVGEDVVHEEEDYRELELLRQQVKLQTSAKFKAARAHLEAAGGAGPSTQDRSVRALLRDSGRVGVHPMMRHIAMQDVEGERGFRAGIPENLSMEDEQTLAQFRTASAKVMGNDGADRDFGGEVPLDSQVYWWHDKYKPRKPKYFNRVHTGYEWNKYNQTHYDYDNPPPKVVQGYKFNILYHDLVDRTQTPQYVLERDPQSTDNSTCIIRFIAGPPYEDIAFRIVNKEWNYARKHGFRCSFERGILHLFFNFKRTRYRR